MAVHELLIATLLAFHSDEAASRFWNKLFPFGHNINLNFILYLIFSGAFRLCVSCSRRSYILTLKSVSWSFSRIPSEEDTFVHRSLFFPVHDDARPLPRLFFFLLCKEQPCESDAPCTSDSTCWFLLEHSRKSRSALHKENALTLIPFSLILAKFNFFC